MRTVFPLPLPQAVEREAERGASHGYNKGRDCMLTVTQSAQEALQKLAENARETPGFKIVMAGFG